MGNNLWESLNQVPAWFIGFITATLIPLLVDFLRIKVIYQPKITAAILGAKKPNGVKNGWQITVAVKNAGQKSDTLTAAYVWNNENDAKEMPDYARDQVTPGSPSRFMNPRLVQADSADTFDLLFYTGSTNPPYKLEILFLSGRKVVIILNEKESSMVAALFEDSQSQVLTAIQEGILKIEPKWFNASATSEFCLSCLSSDS